MKTDDTQLSGFVCYLEEQPIIAVPVSSLILAETPRLDGENINHVHTLAECDDMLPPITVHRETERVIDGVHRLRAAEIRGDETINVRFFDGDEADIFVLAVELNVAHGLPLTMSDRTTAAARIIRLCQHWSDRSIAGVTGLAAKTVAAVRRRCLEHPIESQNRVGQDGRSRPLSAAAGRRRAAELIADKPDATLREVAAAAEVSPSTVRDVRRRLRDGDDPVPQRQQRVERTKQATAFESTLSGPTRHTSRAAILHGLRKDPSLRFSESGRLLLRLLDLHLIDTEVWNSIADNVPAHHAHVIVELARENAESWREFARRVASETNHFIPERGSSVPSDRSGRDAPRPERNTS